MIGTRLLLAALLTAGSTACLWAAAARGEGGITYNRDIRPILSDNCFPCHGSDRNARKAKLRLDVREVALEKEAIVPGKPEESELIARVFTDDEDDLMPPPDSHKKLTAAEKELLKQWIAAGAVYEPHWSFITPKRPPVPKISRTKSKIVNPIDAFILAGLEKHGITPATEADRRTLLRRLSLDLIGLPPSPREMATFLQDRDRDAYEKQVERLLASPHFGERMAVPWLDVVRYADTVGYHGDQNQNIFPYRDYVIDSFNKNKPFDQFTIEQLAGDLLPNSTVEQRIATGFNRLNMVTREGGAQPKEYLAKYGADRVRTVGMTWLGLTVGCAECHDHKFDPFTTKDFYQLKAFFADVKEWGVYNDYKYTPNPDLKDWSNDHPFPPEEIVDSPYLHRRIMKLRDEIAALAESIVGSSVKQKENFATWSKSTAAAPLDSSDGWIFPEPVVVVSTNVFVTTNKVVVTNAVAVSAPAETSGEASKRIESPNQERTRPDAPVSPQRGEGLGLRGDSTSDRQQARSSADAESAPERPVISTNLVMTTNTIISTNFTVEAGNTLLFEPKGDANPIPLRLAEGWVAAVRLELLPHKRHGDDIFRTGNRSASLQVSAVLQRAGEKKPSKLSFYHADADHKEKRYANGFEVIGIRDVWRVSREDAKEKQTGVWLLDPPFKAEAGDQLVLKFNTNVIGSMRVSVSPVPTVAAPGESAGVSQTRLAALARGAPTPLDWFVGTAPDPDAWKEYKQLHRDIIECRDGKSPTLVTVAWKPVTTRVLPRGNWQDESGEIVEPLPPHFLPQEKHDGSRRLTRLDLAQWLVAPENPLTARTVVNRLWKQFFGSGIANPVDDLGLQGDPPTHPELLDWLAVEFRESGWDVKHIVRLIVSSATYRRSSELPPEARELDPHNRLLAAQNPRRLDAEFVRDNALAIAGLLNPEIGGPSAFPYQPPNYYENLQFPDRDYYASEDERQYRRGLYAHWQRTFLQPMLANFDAPGREECVAYRLPSNTPQQALTLLNDPTFVEAARVFAASLLEWPARSDADRLNRAFEKALGRGIRPNERASLERFLAAQREHLQSDGEEAEKIQSVGLAPAPELFDKVELAAWTSVCRVVLNLHEVITVY